MSHPLIELKNVSLTYGQQLIFDNLNLTIQSNSWTAILGASGSGKSSLIKLLAGLTTKQTVTGLLPNITHQIAYMAQTDLLLPWLTVLDNALLANQLASHHSKESALSLLDAAGLTDALHRYPHELSGGMRQRVALVRTLLTDKPIILMDEPFSALDTLTRSRLHTLSLGLLKNKTVIFITHDPLEALKLADDIYLMRGKPASLSHLLHIEHHQPRNLYQPDLLALQATLFHALNEELAC